MNRALKLEVADQVSMLNRITGAFVRLQYDINELRVKSANEDGMSDMIIKVHIEDEDVYRISVIKLKKQVSVINIEDVSDQFLDDALVFYIGHRTQRLAS